MPQLYVLRAKFTLLETHWEYCRKVLLIDATSTPHLDELHQPEAATTVRKANACEGLARLQQQSDGDDS